MTDADLVWNRACGGVCDDARPGDIALASLLLLDGVAHNGGVLHAMEVLNAEAFQAALDGYAYLGLSKPIAALERMVTALSSLSEREFEDAEEALDTDYRTAAEGVFEGFRLRYSVHAEHVAPLSS